MANPGASAAKPVNTKPGNFVKNPQQYTQLVKAGLAGIKDEIAKGQKLIKAYESILADMQSAHNWEKFHTHMVLACAVSVGIADGFAGALAEFHEGARKIKDRYDVGKTFGQTAGKGIAGSAEGSDYATAGVAALSALAKKGASKGAHEGVGAEALGLSIDVKTHVANATISMANQDDDATLDEAKKMGMTGAAAVGKMMTFAKSDRVWMGGMALQGFTKVTNAYMALSKAGQDIGNAASAFAQDREQMGNFDSNKKAMMAKIRDLKTKLSTLETVFYQYLHAMAQHQQEEVAKRSKGGVGKPGHPAAPGKLPAHGAPPKPGMPPKAGLPYKPGIAHKPGHR